MDSSSSEGEAEESDDDTEAEEANRQWEEQTPAWQRDVANGAERGGEGELRG